MNKIFIIVFLFLSGIVYADEPIYRYYKVELKVCPVEYVKDKPIIVDNACVSKEAIYHNSKGCCSRHSGIKSCVNGKVKCRDGTISKSCRC